MASTTYEHPGGFTEMYAAQEHFRDITQMVTKRHHFAVIGNMVRNAGQLPQPFWLGTACGGSSCSFPASVARARRRTDKSCNKTCTAWEERPEDRPVAVR